jgi:hypothetical protein
MQYSYWQHRRIIHKNDETKSENQELHVSLCISTDAVAKMFCFLCCPLPILFRWSSYYVISQHSPVANNPTVFVLDERSCRKLFPDCKPNDIDSIYILLHTFFIHAVNKTISSDRKETAIVIKRFWRAVTTVHDTRDYWVFGLSPSSGILNTTLRKLDLFPSSGEGGRGTPILLGPLGLLGPVIEVDSF